MDQLVENSETPNLPDGVEGADGDQPSTAIDPSELTLAQKIVAIRRHCDAVGKETIEMLSLIHI